MSVWRKISSTKQGTSTMYSAADYNKLMDLLNGVDTGQAVDINNDWNFTKAPTGITGAFDHNAVDTFTNKTIDSAANILQNIGNSLYYVYYTGSVYKARNQKTGAIDSSNADAATVIQYTLTNSSGLGSIYLAPGTYSLSTSLQPPAKTTLVSSPQEAVVLTPSGNFPAVIFNNVQNCEIDNVLFSHNQAGYTSSLIQLREGAAQIHLHNLHFYDYANYKGSCIEFYNNAAAAANAGIYSVFITKCRFYGFVQNAYVRITNSSNWINEIHFTDCLAEHSKYFIYSNVAGGGTCDVDGFVLSGVAWYYHADNPTPTGEAAVMFDDTCNHMWTYMNATVFYDLPSDRNAINTNALSSYYLSGMTPDDKIAGSGAATITTNGSIYKVLPSTSTVLTSPTLKSGNGNAAITFGSSNINFNNIPTYNLRLDVAANQVGVYDTTYTHLFFLAAAGTLAADRTITLPILTANDTFMFEKYSAAVQSPLTKRTGWFLPAAGTTATTIGTVGGILSQHVPTGAGSNTNTFDTTEGTLANFVSGTVAGNYAGLVSPTGGVGIVRRSFAARVVTRAKIDSTTTARYFFGFTSASALPANNAQPLAVADHGIIVGWNETGTGSTNWSIFHNDGATSVTVDNITGPIPKDAAFHTIEINWPAAGNINVIFDGTAQIVSTDLPATNQNLYFNQVAELSSTTARTLSIHGTWIEAEK